jgi:hypothetical protein
MKRGSGPHALTVNTGEKRYSISATAGLKLKAKQKTIRRMFIFAERFRSDISCGGTQSGSAATVTLHEIVCNDWFGSVSFF